VSPERAYDEALLRKKFLEGVRRHVASAIWRRAREAWHPEEKTQETLSRILGFESQAAVSRGIHEGMLSLEGLVAMLVRSDKGWSDLPDMPDVVTRNRVGFLATCQAVGHPIEEDHYEYLRSINSRLGEWNKARASRAQGDGGAALTRLVPVVLAEAGAALEERGRLASIDTAQARQRDVISYLDEVERRVLVALARVHRTLVSLQSGGLAATRELLEVHSRYGNLWLTVFDGNAPA
jgi:hypothetical protein